MSELHPIIQDPARIAAVRELGVLGSGLREPLDRLTVRAARALGAPVSSISLLDGEREYFVTVHGLPRGVLAPRHCPVQRSVCRFTVAAGAPLPIADLRADERVAGPIGLAGLQVIAYLGVPLRGSADAVVGSLCVVDGRPREWSEPEIAVLTELGREVADFLDLRRRVLRRALHDPDSGLPGETLFLARCDASRRRGAEGRSAMYRIEIPDDAPQVGARLAAALHGDHLLGRLDDGAYAVFATELDDERDALRLAAAMRGALRPRGASISAEEHGTGGTIADRVRIGIALCDPPSAPAAEHLRRAAHVIRGLPETGSCIEIARRAA